jgi:anti-anti-sigma factor
MTSTVPPPVARAVPASLATITVGRAGGRSRAVFVRGELDLCSRAQLSEVLSGLISIESADVIIDLADTTFVDTFTIRTFATFRDLLVRSGATMTIRSPSTAVKKMLTWFGLDDVIQDDAQTLAPGGAMTRD